MQAHPVASADTSTYAGKIKLGTKAVQQFESDGQKRLKSYIAPLSSP